jgi:alpha-glucosidase
MPNLEDHFDDMDAAGLLVQDEDGNSLLQPSPAGDASHPDLTSDEARAYVKSFLSAMVEDLGIDGWMADFGEWLPLEARFSDGSDPFAVHNRYPEAWHRLSREVMDELRPEGDWAVFTRSGWTGQQSVAQIVWCGDQEATFEEGDGLPTVVPCMLNLGLAGVPFVTHDIAGFSGGPSTKEVFMRWVELGAFTPIMRTHEGNNKDENWSWEKDAETTDHFRRFTLIHEALKPTMMDLADVAAETSLPMVRHLMLVFPDDPGSRAVSDQFMLGDELLVAPVVTEGATSREVYLPPGTWHHVWSGDTHEGPATITVDAPIGEPPVFATTATHPIFAAIAE